MPKEQVTVWLDPETHQQVVAEAKTRGIPLSQHLAQVIGSRPCLQATDEVARSHRFQGFVDGASISRRQLAEVLRGLRVVYGLPVDGG
jgi:hypothetical protein